MALFVGTSGFLYYGWRGVLYPKDSSPSEWLEIYAEHFNALEINSTFYRLPKKSSLRNYVKYSDRLTFVFKLYRGITHYKKLTPENIEPFFTVKEVLNGSLHCILAQFPGNFKPTEENIEFVKRLVQEFEGLKLVFELRSPQWKEHLQLFEEADVPVCCSDFPEDKGWLKECKSTEEIAYFRFHGRRKLYSDSYTEEELSAFAKTIKESTAKDKLCFFNNTSYGYAVKNALRLRSILEEREGKDEKGSQGYGST